MLSDIVAQIEAALAAATPGPWVDDQAKIDGNTVAYLWSPTANEAVGSVTGAYPWDVALLVNAPQWISALLAERRELVAERDALKGCVVRALTKYPDKEAMCDELERGHFAAKKAQPAGGEGSKAQTGQKEGT